MPCALPVGFRTSFGIVKYMLKYNVNSSAQSDCIRGDNISRGIAHNHFLLEIDLDGEEDDTDTDSIDISSLSSDDDDLPRLVER
eukprot:scaffold31036_cov160-Skeletonema_menzelii.AAC.4